MTARQRTSSTTPLFSSTRNNKHVIVWLSIMMQTNKQSNGELWRTRRRRVFCFDLSTVQSNAHEPSFRQGTIEVTWLGLLTERVAHKRPFSKSRRRQYCTICFYGEEFGWEQVPSYYPKMSAPCPIPIINHYLNLVWKLEELWARVGLFPTKFLNDLFL